MEIAARVAPDPSALPYDRELISWLESERLTGRKICLCPIFNRQLAVRIAAHCDVFDHVLDIDSNDNPRGPIQAVQLVSCFGERGFEFCGSGSQDVTVWKFARGAVLVRADRRLEQRVSRLAPVVRAFSPKSGLLRTLALALRPHQWAKNVLILVPLLAAHRAGEGAALVSALLATVAFCLCASSVYVLNDLLDLPADRAHARKCKRPFAAGDLSIMTGLVVAPLLMISALLITLLLPGSLRVALWTYYGFTVAYSFALKGLVVVDAVALAGLYTLRIVAGGAAVDLPLSFWLLLFSVFLFLSLAFAKRYTELDSLRRQNLLRVAGRGYEVDDLPVLQTLGVAAGYLSVLVLALYINSPEVEALYRHPRVIWTLCILMLYWISRVWMQAHRGALNEDPVVFALKDRVSLAIGVLATISVIAAV